MAKKLKTRITENQITEETIETSDRYISLNYMDLEDGLYTLCSPQGTGKTGITNTIHEGKKVLSIGSRNELGEQTKVRCPEQIHTTHRLSEKKYINRDVLQASTNLWINYSSLKKLTEHRAIEYDYLIIDEPVLLGQHSTEYKPDAQDEAEYNYRIISTPKVIFTGAEIPDYLKREIRKYAQLRKETFPLLSNQIIHFKNDYQILKGKTFRFVKTKEQRNSEIAKTLKWRMDSCDFEQGHWFGKGVLIVTEYGQAVNNIKAEWEQWYRNHYPDFKPNIVAVWSKNSTDYQEYLESLSNSKKYSAIDILIISPVWGQGLNIRNEFDLTVGDFVRNTKMPLTYREQLHLMTRDRDCTRYVIQDRDSVIEDNYNIQSIGSIKSIDDLVKYYPEFGIKKDKLLIRNTDGSTRNIAETLTTRLIESTVDSYLDRWNRDIQLRKELIRLGATEETAPIEIQKNLPQAVKEDQNKLILECDPYNEEEANDSITYREDHRRIKHHIEKDLGRPCISQREIDQWANNNYLDNEANRRYLDTKHFETIKETEKDTSELYQAVYVIKECINFIREIGVITAEQLNLNPLWTDLIKQQHHYNRLIQELGWYECDIKHETTNDSIYWLQKILKRFNYHVELNRNGVDADLKTAQKEHNPDFTKWKKIYRARNKVDGYLKYYDYLWHGLNDGSLIYSKLGPDTKKYIKSFPHLIIKNYPTRIRGTKHV
jgi:hypothetical protein